MIHKWLILPLSFVILACGSSSSEKSSSQDSLQNTSGSIPSVVLTNSFPILIDTSVKNTVPVERNFVRNSIVPMDAQKENSSWLKDFLMIDSLKVAGKYEEYVEKLDIGQLKNAEAFLYNKFSYGKGNAYIWSLSVGSYEACPYYGGNVVYLSTVSNDGVHKSTRKILELMTGGDAPMFSSDWGVCRIEKDLTITCRDTSLVGEYTDAGYEETTATPGLRTYKIDQEGMINETANTKGAEIKKEKITVQ